MIAESMGGNRVTRGLFRKDSVKRVATCIVLTSLIGFVCLTLVGCSLEKACIERVLQEDSESSENAESVSEVVARMRAIDTSGCPADFRTAYLAHIHAWEEARKVEQEAKKLGKPDGFWDGLQAISLKNAGNSASQKIGQTFQEVERVAVLHGAKLPSPKPASE